jgi:hypothetical protein
MALYTAIIEFLNGCDTMSFQFYANTLDECAEEVAYYLAENFEYIADPYDLQQHFNPVPTLKNFWVGCFISQDATAEEDNGTFLINLIKTEDQE